MFDVDKFTTATILGKFFGLRLEEWYDQATKGNMTND